MRRPIRTWRSIAYTVVLVAIAMFLTSSIAQGQPITYTGFVITDGQLGAWQFHNARVIFTFQSDTRYVQVLNIPVPGHRLLRV